MQDSETYPVRRAGGRLAAFGWTLTVLAIAAAAYDVLGARQVALFAVGLSIGAVLLHTEFGFTGSLRRFVVDRDFEALRAPLALLALTTLTLAPALAAGEAFGPVSAYD